MANQQEPQSDSNGRRDIRLSVMNLLDSRTVGNLIILFIALTVAPPATWYMIRAGAESTKQTEILRTVQDSIKDREGFQTKMIDRESDNRDMNRSQVDALKVVLENQKKIVDAQVKQSEANSECQLRISAEHKQMLEEHQTIIKTLCSGKPKQNDKPAPMPDNHG